MVSGGKVYALGYSSLTKRESNPARRELVEPTQEEQRIILSQIQVQLETIVYLRQTLIQER